MLHLYFFNLLYKTKTIKILVLDCLQLIAYILRDKRRQKIIYELNFYDLKNFEQVFSNALKPKIPRKF